MNNPVFTAIRIFQYLTVYEQHSYGTNRLSSSSSPFKKCLLDSERKLNMYDFVIWFPFFFSLHTCTCSNSNGKKGNL